MSIKCPYCGHEGTPMISKTLSSSGLIILIVLLFACFPLFWLPLVLDSCKDDVRKCAACGIKMG